VIGNLGGMTPTIEPRYGPLPFPRYGPRSFGGGYVESCDLGAGPVNAENHTIRTGVRRAAVASRLSGVDESKCTMGRPYGSVSSVRPSEYGQERSM
jgi:hypothetical protein